MSLAILILFGSTYLTYQLAAYSGDPLAGIRESTDPKKDVIIRELTKTLNLDIPPPARYFLWLKGALGVFVGKPDFGKTAILRLPVADQVAAAIPMTVRLVTLSTLLAIVLGITFGILSSIRQYSRLDYSLTFLSFLLFSLPVFWVAVLLKEYMAIQFNNFLTNSTIDITWNLVASAIIAVILTGFVSGTRKRVVITWSITFVTLVALFAMASATHWFRTPNMGIFTVGILGASVSVGMTNVFAGLGNKKALYAGLTSVGIGVAMYYPFNMLANGATTYLMLGAFAVLMLAVSYFVGYFFTKVDRGPVIRVSMLSAFFVSMFTFLRSLTS